MITRRLYYDDAFATEFTARVKSCEPALVPFSPVAKAPAWEVVLDQTAFYPTSGGQPHDLGKLVLVNAAGLWIPEHPIPDLFALLPFEFATLLFHDPTAGAAMLTPSPAARRPRRGCGR